MFSLAVRKFSTAQAARAATGDLPAGYTLLKQKQKTFNIDNGLRVHQRGGTMDSVLYNTTLAFMIAGGFFWVKNVITMSFPQKN